MRYEGYRHSNKRFILPKCAGKGYFVFVVAVLVILACNYAGCVRLVVAATLVVALD